METVSILMQQREELRSIQSQQQERFQSRKQYLKKSDSLNSSTDQLSLETVTQTLKKGVSECVSDETDFSRSACSSYEAPDEKDLCALDSLQQENSKLKSQLRELELKILDLKKIRENGEIIGKLDTNPAQKIIEMSKRNRELNSMLSAEKNKVRQLSKKMKDLGEGEQKTATCTQSKEDYGVENDGTLKILKAQLEQCNMKLMEYRNNNQIIKQELKLAQKVITKEVGEVNISSLLIGASGWRGRAQQIINLQNKVAEMKKKLAAADGHEIGSIQKSTCAFDCSDARQKATLQRIEQQKKLKETQLELDSLRDKYASLQQQCKAIKARNKTLTSALKHAKSESKLAAENPSTRCTSSSSSTMINSADFHAQLRLERHQWEKERTELKIENKLIKQQLDNCLSKLREVDNSVDDNEERLSDSSKHHSLLESNALLQVSNLERDKLFELSKSLQQRLDSTTNRAMKLEMALRDLKHRTTVPLRKRSQKKASIAVEDELCSDLESQVILLRNENDVLRETLELTRHEKLEDILLLNSMVQEAKQVFMDNIKRT